MTGTVRYALVSWVIFFAIYEALAGKPSTAEIAVGAIVACVPAFLLLRVSKKSPYHFRIGGGWLGKLASVPLQMLRDCGVVYGAILRRPGQTRGTGRFQLRPFDPGNEHPAARARRALVTLGVSLAPNSYVIGRTAPPNEQLLVHQLVPEKSRPRDPAWPL